MGLPVTKEIQDALVSAYLGGATLDEAAAPYGLSNKATRNALKKHGLKARKNDGWNRVYDLDESFFESIDSEEKAYWLGFIVADGSVYKPIYKMTVGLSSRDKGHVEKLRQALRYGCDVKIRMTSSGNSNRHEIAMLEVSSKKMTADLEALGVTQNKTFTATPWKGPPELMRHFWRGVFDGDGCIHRLKGKANTWQVFVVGTKEICEGFASFAEEVTGTRPTISPHGKIFRARFSGFSSPQSVIRSMYEGASVSLDRKRELADILINAVKMKPGPKPKNPSGK